MNFVYFGVLLLLLRFGSVTAGAAAWNWISMDWIGGGGDDHDGLNALLVTGWLAGWMVLLVGWLDGIHLGAPLYVWLDTFCGFMSFLCYFQFFEYFC